MSHQADLNLQVELAGITLRNPVMVASGTFGYGPEYAEYVDLNRLGAIVVKGISYAPWHGNPLPRMVEVSGGLLNAIGLQGPGAEGFASKYMPFLRGFDVPVIVNIWGRSLEEYIKIAAFMDGLEGVAAVELNISCPNVKEGGIAFGTDLVMAREVIGEVRAATSLPLIPKLSPNIPNVGAFAAMAEEAGADALSLINTLPAMAIDIEARKPILSNISGGLSGPGIRPVAIKQVWDASHAVSIPIIGMGGIYRAEDAVEFLMAGATAVAVGTANFTNPRASLDVIEGLGQWMLSHGVQDVHELVGAAHG
jgi:dihydroorotate dehydrogenase (NAD+) catalytic subunit